MKEVLEYLDKELESYQKLLARVKENDYDGNEEEKTRHTLYVESVITRIKHIRERTIENERKFKRLEDLGII